MRRYVYGILALLVYSYVNLPKAQATYTVLRDAGNLSRGKLPNERIDCTSVTCLGSNIGIDVSAASTTLQNQINFISTSFTTGSQKNDAVSADTQTIRTAVSTNAVAMGALQTAFTTNTANIGMLLTQGTSITLRLDGVRTDTTTIKSNFDTFGSTVQPKINVLLTHGTTVTLRLDGVRVDTTTLKTNFDAFTSTTQSQITNALNSNATAQTYAEATRNAISSTTADLMNMSVPVRVSNEGGSVTNGVTAIDCVGGGIDCTASGSTVTVTVNSIPMALGFTDDEVYVSSPTQIDCSGPGISCRKFGDVLRLEVLGSSSTDWTVTGREGGVVIGTSAVGAPDIVSTNSDGFIFAISTHGGSSSGLGNVYVQNGNYVLTKAIGFPSGITTYCASSTSLILSGASSQIIASGTFINCNFEIYGSGADKMLLKDGARILGGNVNKVTVETGATTGKFVLRNSSNVVIDNVYFRQISYTASNAALFLHQGATNFRMTNCTVDAPVAESGAGNNFMEYIGGNYMLIKGNTFALANRFMFADVRSGGELAGPSTHMKFDDNNFTFTGFADGSGLFFFLTNTGGLDVSTANAFTHNTFTINTTGTETVFGFALTTGKVTGIDISNNEIQNINGAAAITFITQDTEAEGVAYNNYLTGFDTFISGTGSILYVGRNNFMDGTPQ